MCIIMFIIVITIAITITITIVNYYYYYHYYYDPFLVRPAGSGWTASGSGAIPRPFVLRNRGDSRTIPYVILILPT